MDRRDFLGGSIGAFISSAIIARVPRREADMPERAIVLPKRQIVVPGKVRLHGGPQDIEIEWPSAPAVTVCLLDAHIVALSLERDPIECVSNDRWAKYGPDKSLTLNISLKGVGCYADQQGRQRLVDTPHYCKLP
ncbi:hypothetical protein LCGC14_0323530 [marine sediment metagenome]|uniref:Uncharacterized protein n=1 Tax=marine sediment metagenome TaxID=412755 RepID=A0A0F9TP73_9ZZZZ